MPHPLDRLLIQGEHQTQDFKYFLSDARKIARSLAAFANTDGGRLLVGVKDNGQVVGLKYGEEEVYVVESAARVYCRPAIEYSCRFWDYYGKRVMEVIVEPGTLAHTAPDENGNFKYYLRRADENKLAGEIEAGVLVWRRDASMRAAKIGRNEEKIFEVLRSLGPMDAEDLIRRSMLSKNDGQSSLIQLIGCGALEMDDSGIIWFSEGHESQ